MEACNVFMMYWDPREKDEYDRGVNNTAHLTDVSVCSIGKILQRATKATVKEVHDCYAAKMGTGSISANHEMHFVYAGY